MASIAAKGCWTPRVEKLGLAYMTITEREIWLSLYLVNVICSRKVVSWDLAEREDPIIAAALVSLACFREQIRKGWKSWAC